jgi:hypothetical protein
MALLFMVTAKHALDVIIITSAHRVETWYGRDRTIVVSKEGGTIARVVDTLKEQNHTKSKVLVFGRVDGGRFQGVTNEHLGSGFNTLSKVCNMPILVMKMDFEHRLIRLEVVRTHAYPDRLISVEEIRTALSTPWAPYTVIGDTWWSPDHRAKRVVFQCNPTPECIEAQQLISHRLKHWIGTQCLYGLIWSILLIGSIVLIYRKRKQFRRSGGWVRNELQGLN